MASRGGMSRSRKTQKARPPAGDRSRQSSRDEVKSDQSTSSEVDTNGLSVRLSRRQQKKLKKIREKYGEQDGTLFIPFSSSSPAL